MYPYEITENMTVVLILLLCIDAGFAYCVRHDACICMCNNIACLFFLYSKDFVLNVYRYSDMESNSFAG